MNDGAGYGDRTRLTGLGSQSITTMLSPLARTTIYITGSHINHRPWGGWLSRNGLLPFAKGHDQRHASRPRRQPIGDGEELERKCWQKQRMEPEDPPGQNHGRHVEDLIGKRPADRTQQQLEYVR